MNFKTKISLSPTDSGRSRKTRWKCIHRQDYAAKMFRLVICRHTSASMIIFVNDPYDTEMSIKDSEHQRRQEADTSAYAHGSKNVFIQQHEKLPSSLEMNKFFTNSRNKIRLQEFLKGQFLFHAQQHPDIYFVQRTCFNLSRNSNCSRLPEFECLHTEADTILLFLYA
jgi:hypothetical protein